MNDRARHERIRALFEQALSCAGEERDSLLDELCADDSKLRPEVEALLEHAQASLPSEHPYSEKQVEAVRDRLEAIFENAGDVTEATSAESAHDGSEGPILLQGVVVGRFTIERLVGQGGMGAVYAATQDRPHRTVALKLIRPGYASARMLRRFEVEAEFLGRLHHPGIAQIHDAGVAETAHGKQPFFAMELIDGMPLNEYARREGLGTRERLALIASIADAVEHAHQNGVIHRDLKPGNILVDAAGQPKVLDFGVARTTDSDIQFTTMQTAMGALIGTIPYMSPEQAGGDPGALDTRSDVYALGVVAYELLTDRLPYDVTNKMIHEAVRVIREEDPTSISTLNRTLRGDVETILGKALEKDKDRRYQSASEFAADIRRYLANEPITARPPSTIYQLGKFTRRHKAVVVGVVAVFVVLVAGFVVSTVFAIRAERSRAEVVSTLDDLELVAAFQAEQLLDLDATRMGSTLRDSLIEQRRVVLRRAGTDDDAIEQVVTELGAALAGISFTDIALESLDETIFERTLAAIDAQFADQPLVRAQLLLTTAGVLHDLGLLERALPVQEEGLRIHREMLGDEDPITLITLGRMGQLLESLGRYDEAERIQRDALSASRSILGDAHPDTLVTQTYLASVLDSKGAYDEAESLYREALASLRREMGDDHEFTLKAINDLGLIMDRLGRYEESEALYREVLERSRRTLGDDASMTMNAGANLGNAYWEQGRLDEALPHYETALASMRRVLGNEHPDTLVMLSNTGVLYQSLGRYAQAEALQREALDVMGRTLGDEHPDTLFLRGNLGTLLMAQGKYAEAEPILRISLEARRRLLGNEHPSTLTSIGNYGALLSNLGRRDEAEPLYREALDANRRINGDDHPTTLTAIGNMGSLLNAQGKLDEAEAYYRESLEASRRVLGDDHPDTLVSIGNMGSLLESQGRYEEAEAYCREALDRSRRVLGEDHPGTLRTLNNLADLYRTLERYEESEACFRRAVDHARESLPRDHYYTDAFLRNHASVLRAMGRFAEAAAALEEARANAEDALGPAHERTTRAIRALADLHDTWHEVDPDAGHEARAEHWRRVLDAPDAGAAESPGDK